MLGPVSRFAALAAALLTATPVSALDFPTNDSDALSSIVKQISNGVVEFDVEDYYGPGLFPDPYTWTESATAWDSLVGYWYLTGDTTHNAAVQTALVGQLGPALDYLPPNQSLHMSNWRQSSWALAALSAAERGLPVESESENVTSWEDLARDAFDTQVPRWDDTTCGGGLRTDIFMFGDEYNSKDSLSQSTFFLLAARLARFTGNQTYVDLAARAYDWMREVKLIDDDFAVYYNASTTQNCSQVDDTQWSQAAAAIAYGSAVLANITSSTEWADRTTSHVEHILNYFFPSDILTSPACTDASTNYYCWGEAHAAEASTLRWLSLVPVFQPATHDSIHAALAATAKAAADACTTTDGGASASCKGLWSVSDDDEEQFDDDDPRTDVPRNATIGLGQQVVALEALQAAGFILSSADGVNASFVLRTANGTTATTTTLSSNGDGSSSSSSTSTGSASGASGTQTGAAAAGGLLRAASSAWGALGVAGLVGFATAVLV
ncbi:Glycoside hydrolase family 76 [Lasiodiplodia theobromae]|nr:Glycoside hydrolase family 76 [Lasiodiplodia theobromae]